MSLVDYSVDGAVATITLDRPPVNALNAELIGEVGAAVDRAAAPEVRAVVITGTPYFAAGADIGGFVEALETGPEDRQSAGLLAVVGRFEALRKPTIAAITGYALGGGLELALGADFRYLADDAKVGQPEVRLGIIPGAGGTQRLARIIGYQRAKEMNMTGRHVTADVAAALGLADRVLAEEDLVATAHEDAASFASGPTQAYAALKWAMRIGYDLPLAEALEVERTAFAEAFATDDARVGVAAFLDKTKPDFTGT